MQNIKTITLSLIIGISLAAGITFATSNWQGCTDCGTDGISTGVVISAENIKANFDYLYNQVATGGIWTKSGTDMYYNDGNVGIGTTTPAQKLDVAGTVRIDQGSNYDIWLQGGSATSGQARNLALLGVKGTDTLYLNYGGEYTGGVQMSGSKIRGLGTPTASTDAATKGYVDSSVAGGLVLYGGSFRKYFVGEAYICSGPNIITGSCSCPTGYSPRTLSSDVFYTVVCEKVAN